MSTRLRRDVRLGIKSLMLHKLRSLLTILGVVFGVGSVVAMLSVGEGASAQALREIQKLGSNNIIVRSMKPREASDSNNQSRSRTLEYGILYDDLERIRTYPAIRKVAPAKIKERAVARLGRRASNVRLVGTTPEWFALVPREVIAGRVFNPQDILTSTQACVLAEEAARDLLAGEDSIGETITLDGDTYVVIGIIRTEAGGSGVQLPDRSIDAYVPLNVMRQRNGDTITQRSSGSFSREKVELHQIVMEVGSTGGSASQAHSSANTSGILARASGWLGSLIGAGDAQAQVPAIDNVSPTAEAIRAGLERFHEKTDFEVSVPLALLRQARETRRIFNIVLGSIAGISLLVGGIGIMNIMLASVTERTREIGVRRAIGARRSQILRQFLIETVTLSLIGGLLGVTFGLLIPAIIERYADMPTVVTAWSVLLALGVSALVGVVFGLYPAYRAAHLDPIVALRHE